MAQDRNSASKTAEQPLAADWLYLGLIVALPLMKPAIAYPITAADLIFLCLAVAILGEVIFLGRAIDWNWAFGILAIYLVSLSPSLLASPDPALSGFKLTTEVYLAGLAAATMVLIRSEASLRRAVLAWLAATSVLSGLAVLSLIAFAVAPDGALYNYSRFHFGTLPPGDYPRLALTFFNANLACNYLTVSLGLLFVAWQQAWLPPRAARWLLALILLASLTTLSPGLGGIALGLGSGLWLLRGSRLALWLGIAAALIALILTAFTPIAHSTAPFVLGIPGTTFVIAPSGRFLTWSAALAEFAAHPILGHGLGVDAVDVRYADPSGNLQQLTDAHNMILGIAAQAGVIGLIGLGALIVAAIRLTSGGSDGLRLGLGLTFLNAFVYQGLSGSFEDSRHLWVLFGLLAAAARLPVIRPDGNNRRAGAPSPC